MAREEAGVPHRRRRLKGVEVRPEAIRQARYEAGLSLAGVAGQDLTRAAIHLIETGRARPSMPTLELIARRTGKPVDYFLANTVARGDGRGCPDARLVKIEELVESDQFEQAVLEASELLGQVKDSIDRARLQHWLGLSHMMLRQTEPAYSHLRAAREVFEAAGDKLMVAECLDAESGALHWEQNPQAVEVSQAALDLCRQLDPVPAALEARILGHLGSIHVQRNDWDLAISSFEAALAAAGPLRDLSRMAQMYMGLSRVYDELGRPAQQMAYTQKALGVLTIVHDRAAMAAAENNLGMAYLKQGLLDEAFAHLNESLAQFGVIGVERQRAQVHLSLAELHLTRHDLDEAAASAAEAVSLADRLGEMLNAGLGHQFLGRIAAARGEDETADKEFELALAIFHGASAEERVIECHSAYAEVLEARGDARRALWHARKALAISRPLLGRREAAEGSEAVAG